MRTPVVALRQVCVRSFPEATGQWQASSSGGIEPRWRGDGRELFFIGADRKPMGVPVNTDTFQAGTPTALFATRLEASARLGIIGRNQYVVTSNGQRFLVRQPPADAAPTPITVVLNWRPAGSR